MPQDQKQLFLYGFQKPLVMAFPNLFAARAFKRNGKEVGAAKFGASFVIDPSNPELNAVKAVAAQAAKHKWPGRSLQTVKFPFKDGSVLADRRNEKTGKDDGDFQRGKVILKAASQFQPDLGIIIDGSLVTYEGDDLNRKDVQRRFFFGAEALVQVEFVGYEGDDSDVVTAYLKKVYVTGGGTKLSGGSNAAEVFKGYIGSVTTDDPTKGLGGFGEDVGLISSNFDRRQTTRPRDFDDDIPF